MQGQVLQALVDCDLVRANCLRTMAKQDFRGLLLFVGRANAHQKDELASHQLTFKVPDTLACEGASQLCSEPPGSSPPTAAATPAHITSPPDSTTSQAANPAPAKITIDRTSDQ